MVGRKKINNTEEKINNLPMLDRKTNFNIFLYKILEFFDLKLQINPYFVKYAYLENTVPAFSLNVWKRLSGWYLIKIKIIKGSLSLSLLFCGLISIGRITIYSIFISLEKKLIQENYSLQTMIYF